MLILAIDTSTRTGGVALGWRGEVLAESVLPVTASGSEVVLPEVDRILRRCGREAAEIEGVAVGAGPGSFTGVRIAASLAKGLVFAGEMRLYAYSSLAIIAAGSGTREAVCSLIDARRGQVYAAGYHTEAGIVEIFPPRAVSLPSLLSELAPVEQWTFAGSIDADARGLVRKAGGRLLPPHLGIPRAGSLVWLVHTAREHGEVEDPWDWEPQYIRLPGAARGASS